MMGVSTASLNKGFSEKTLNQSCHLAAKDMRKVGAGGTAVVKNQARRTVNRRNIAAGIGPRSHPSERRSC